MASTFSHRAELDAVPGLLSVVHAKERIIVGRLDVRDLIYREMDLFVPAEKVQVGI